MPDESESPENSGKVQASAPQGTFAMQLDWHLNFGTRPSGRFNRPGKRWTNSEFATAVGGAHERTVRNWRRGRTLPQDLPSIERELFGEGDTNGMWQQQLRQAYDNEKRHESAAPDSPLSTVEPPVRCLGRASDIAALVFCLANIVV
jgi:hypothetical protein